MSRHQRKDNSIAIILVVLLLLVGVCQQAFGADIEWLVEVEHSSDLLRGDAPWASHVPEPYYDHVMTGVTITLGRNKRFELDALHGYKRFAGTAWRAGGWQTGTVGRVRWYPRRNR